MVQNPVEIWRENVGLIMEAVKGVYSDEDGEETLRRYDASGIVAKQFTQCLLQDLHGLLMVVLESAVHEQRPIDNMAQRIALTAWRTVRATKAHRAYAQMVGRPPAEMGHLNLGVIMRLAMKAAEYRVVDTLENLLSDLDPDEDCPADAVAYENMLAAYEAEMLKPSA